MAFSNMNSTIIQKSILFVVGLLGVGHETLVAKTERPTLLLLFAAMVGLPAFLSRDEKIEKKKEDKGEP